MDPNQPILMSAFDHRRLRGLLGVLRGRLRAIPWQLRALEAFLDRATVLAPEQIPAYLVTMNSRVRLSRLDTSERVTASLVFPGGRPIEGVGIPVLSRLGLSLFGRREGDVIQLSTEEGLRALRVEEILYQPEAAGDYVL